MMHAGTSLRPNRQCCRWKCTDVFDTSSSLKDRVATLRQDLAKMSNVEMNQKVLQLMACMKLDDAGSEIKQYMLYGEEICRQVSLTFIDSYGLYLKLTRKHIQVQRLMPGLRSGQVPEDLRRMNAFMGQAASQVSFSEAEPLAETDESELNLQVAALTELEGVDGLEDEGPAFDKALPEHALAETNPVIEGLLNIGGPDVSAEGRRARGKHGSRGRGVVECYFLYEADMVKNPGTEFSMLAMGLDEAKAVLTARGTRMPQHLIIETDNAVKEGKNQVMAFGSSWLISTNQPFVCISLFRSVSHNYAQDFVERIQATLKPVRGRELVVKMVTGSYDFSVYFSHLGVQVSGLDLPKFHRATETSWTVHELEDEEYTAAPNDAIMLVKEWVTSSCLSQPPQLILPSSFLGRLKDVALVPNGRNVLPQRTADEFRKSAKCFGSEPWCLTEAENYLTDWVDANQRGVHPAPPELKFIWEKSSNLDLWKEYAPGEVRVVTATARPKPKSVAAKAKVKAQAESQATPKAVAKNKAKAAKAKASAPSGKQDQRGQKRPAPDEAEGEVPDQPAAAAAPRGRFGCSKCRYLPGGCRQCRDPAYTARRAAVR
ncbi:hypothetical protein AK812_SmicGene39525 [Symbiodinium microadriaticum]|uniref:Uncharacterized protein n=1 Tax=Symbiodinium microadriaticum TaxID=2951 RepID=A0A1Q9CB13_SYMMI|nr:hypothetical protein AK812_SmicGene39525 [Symbiodinium microadriaticum]